MEVVASSNRRLSLRPPSDLEVVTVLMGEIERTSRVGPIVSVLALRLRQGFINVRLDFGLEGVINEEAENLDCVVKKARTTSGVIIDVKFNLFEDSIYVVLSPRPTDVRRRSRN